MSVAMDIQEQDQFAWVEWMIAERERLDMSQADLANKTGLTRTTISDYERRERPNPDIRALVKISRALGHHPLWLPRLAGLIPPETELDPDLEDIIAHRFRHTFAVEYLKNGGNAFALQAMLGHSTLETVRIYVRLAQVDIDQVHRRASPVDNWRL